MQSTRKQRREFIKSLKKKNPNISKKELDEAKKQMSDLGQEQYIKTRESVINQTLGNEEEIESLEVDLDDEITPIDLEDDITPEDLDE